MSTHTRALLSLCFLPVLVNAFGIPSPQRVDQALNARTDDVLLGFESECTSSRRTLLSLAGLGMTSLVLGKPLRASAAVGALPEFSDSNAILQGLTIKVADRSQQDAMIKFLEDGFDFKVLRKRIAGSLEETWLGFGPEQLSIPSDFTRVSSFGQYGGHASIHMIYDARAPAPLYRVGDSAPGDDIAFLQVGVPQYRVSQLVKNGGNVLDAYGIINVVSPSGLPMRGIIGIAPDPIMFVAINCSNVEKSKAFYQQLGFVEQEYPYARPSKGQGQFEPPQPKKAVYMAPSSNCMGVLLLPSKKKNISQNPVIQSLNIVYNPSQEGAKDEEGGQTIMYDPSGVPIRFQSVGEFEVEEKITR